MLWRCCLCGGAAIVVMVVQPFIVLLLLLLLVVIILMGCIKRCGKVLLTAAAAIIIRPPLVAAVRTGLVEMVQVLLDLDVPQLHSQQPDMNGQQHYAAAAVAASENHGRCSLDSALQEAM